MTPIPPPTPCAGMLEQEHRMLEELVAQVQEICACADADMELMRVLTDMYLYAKAHFFDEEWLMERLCYPERAAHAALHREFLERTHALADDCLEGRLDYGALSGFLRAWLVEHVEGDDARIAAFARESGQEALLGA